MTHRAKTVCKTRRRRHLSKPYAGFTLLEVMIAVSIIAIVLVSVYKMQAQTISMNAMSQYQTTASLLAQQKMAELEIASPGSMASGSGDFGNAFPDFEWRITVDEVESEFLGDAAEDLKKVVVAVSLKQDQDLYTATLYRFPRD